MPLWLPRPNPQFITEKRCLVNIPKKITVADILAEFLAAKKQRTSVDKVFAEVAEGECSAVVPQPAVRGCSHFAGLLFPRPLLASGCTLTAHSALFFYTALSASNTRTTLVRAALRAHVCVCVCRLRLDFAPLCSSLPSSSCPAQLVETPKS